MSSNWIRIAGMAVGFAVLLGTGYWLTRAGKPYGQIQFTIHKIVALAMLASIVWSAIATNKATPLGTLDWAAVSLAVLVFVVLIGTGGALSAMSAPPSLVRWIHRIAPYVSIPLTVAWLYLLSRGSG